MNGTVEMAQEALRERNKARVSVRRSRCAFIVTNVAYAVALAVALGAGYVLGGGQ